MIYVEAPEVCASFVVEKHPAIYLAGGISDCPGWQFEVARMLGETEYTVLNPCRVDFPMDDPHAAEQQIVWEYRHLRLADAILFWFPCETLCPITLYELGQWSATQKPLFVGVHPDYKRRRDVEIQMGLSRPNVEIVYSLRALADQVIAAFELVRGGWK